MYFYVDESGNTGNNLFDPAQPFLYYGILRCDVDLDVEAAAVVESARQHIGVDRLHAAELGFGSLVKIGEHLEELQRQLHPVFDLYRVAKPDLAVISFFDQVFDQGLNPAVTWTGYWTPLRYVLLIKLACLFCEETRKLAWAARLQRRDDRAEPDILKVCEVLTSRLAVLPDARSRQLIGDALSWASNNFARLAYNCKNKQQVRNVSPNLIGFQFVMHGIARQLETPQSASRILVDEQSEFNAAQRRLAEFYAAHRDSEWITGPGLPRMDLSKMPQVPVEALPHDMPSIGLELVDVYLWISKRLMEGDALPSGLIPGVGPAFSKASFEELSLPAIERRWAEKFRSLPEPTPESEARGREIIDLDERRRLRSMRESAVGRSLEGGT